MQFVSKVLALTNAKQALIVNEVWDFKDSELSDIAQRTTHLLKDSSASFLSKTLKVAALSQAILEFQDLITMMLPQKGRIGSVNYLFYEGISLIREAMLIGISGLTHSSFAAFRSAVEMLVLHEWWRERLFFAESYEDFYDWLEGRRRPADILT